MAKERHGREARAWAQAQFGAVDLGDKRRTRRLVEVAAAVREAPGASLPRATRDWSALVGGYRVLHNRAVTHEGVIAAHTAQVRAAAQAPGDYLLVSDTTFLSFSHRERPVKGLGPLTHPDSQGLVVHTTLALRVVDAQPGSTPAVELLGLWDQQVWSRTAASETQTEAESAKWRRPVGVAGPPPPGARWTHVWDREGDVFEALAECRAQRAGWLVRAAQPRALADPAGTLFEAVARARVLGTFEHRVPARADQPARTARLEVRAARVTLKPPRRLGTRYEALTTGVVEAREVDPPAGEEALHWVLLTSLACRTFKQALKVVRRYTLRWRVEEFHKALKTGTNIERSQLRDAAALEVLLGVCAVVAADLVRLQWLARARPHAPLEPGLLSPEAWAVLEATYGRPAEGWTHASALVAVARLGGFLARKGDGLPGWQTLWHGYKRLLVLAEGYRLARDRP